MKQKYRFLLVLLLVVLLPGCISFKTDKKPTGPQGYYRSDDGGLTWAHKVNLMNPANQPLTIAGVNIFRIIFDPSNYDTIYLVTDSGLIYSLNNGESWQQDPFFGSIAINDIAVDYFDKCTVFMAAGQSIYRTKDCLRTWEEVYFDRTRPNLQITDIETEDYNQGYIYAANSQGEILKSTDFGATWKTKRTINNPIRQILIDKDDTRIIYFATDSAGLFKTIDGGETWSDTKPETNLNNGLNKFPDTRAYRLLVQDPTRKNSFFWVCRYGLLKTGDGGITWEPIKLITPPSSVDISAFALDPLNINKMLYGTATTIYITTDGGQTWATESSPTFGILNYMIYRPDSSEIIHLGVKAAPQ